jgi:TPR repeat protein
MSRIPGLRSLFLAAAMFSAAAAHADLPSAQKAYAAKDFPTAFGLYREIAELGNLTGQENLAAMYVDGEGVARDNVLGYAWAVIARENGGGAAMQNIIDQLEPHLNDKSRARVKELTDLFGKAALAERLLPGELHATPNRPGEEQCRITQPVNPDDFYPPSAVREGLSGTVFMEVRVSVDGHAHRPVVWYSFPQSVFDFAGRAIGWTNGYAPKKLNGVPQTCSIRFKVKFHSKSSNDARMTEAYKKSKALAETGDPVAQVIYGLLMFDRETAAEKTGRPLDWFLKAAQAGNPYAQYLVGVDMVSLERIAPDAVNAREFAKGLIWLKLAAANDRPEAKFALANYQMATHPEAVSDPVVFAWLEDAARAGHRDGTLYLAALLAAGPDASHRDPARALTLVDLSKWDFDSDPTAIEVLAAANAQLQKFDRAVSLQDRAIRGATRFHWDLAPLKERLAKYQANTAWTGNLIEP